MKLFCGQTVHICRLKMGHTMKLKNLLSATALASVSFALPQVAWAQTAPVSPNATEEEADEQAAETEEGAVVVTGSRIVRPTLDSAVPVTSVSVGELTSNSTVVLGDALNELPALRSTFSTGNSGRAIGTSGLNILDLRGLGVARTLVLVNGRRHVTGLVGEFLVDTNTIPTDLLERVDIVTGGNSAVYGSDAVAGVVNFVLKCNFDGVVVRGQGGISERGDRGQYFISVTAGQNFAEGRGNIAISAEYVNAQPVRFVDRDSQTGAYSGRCQFNTTDDTAGEPPAGDGIPDQTFACGTVNNSISDGGTIGAFADGRAVRFDPNGNVFIDTPRVFFGSFNPGFVIGSQGSTLRNTGLLAAGVDRYNVNVIARFEVADALQPFIEAKYVRTEANQEGQPSFFQGGALGTFSCTNPFLNAQALTAIQGVGLCGGAGANPAGRTFGLSRFNTDFGGRGEINTRETYRIVGGIEGRFNDDWRYEIAVNYGRFESKGDSLNNLVLGDLNGNDDGFTLARNPALAPAGFAGSNFVTNSTGQRVICAINAGAAGNVRPDCVPIDLFGLNRADPRALDFIQRTTTNEAWAEQFVVSAFVAGDSSQLFELPGGPIQFALGGEYRTERAFQAYEDLVRVGGTFLNELQPFTPPTYKVAELYGELRFPILRDLPFAELLSIEAAGRVSDYRGAADAIGSVTAYNLSAIYAPTPDIRFRANYSTSVRSPTLGDLFGANNQSFAFLADPCDSANIGANPNRAANCAAAGVPVLFTPATQAACAGTAFETRPTTQPFVNCLARSVSLPFLVGGRPDLTEERARSLTLGAVFTPSAVPGLSLTVDYYRIRLKNRIETLSAQASINACFDTDPAAFAANPFCTNISRDPATGLFNEPVTIVQGINFAEQRTQGVDFDLLYSRSFDNGHRVQLRGIATYVIELDNFINPTDPTQRVRQLSNLGDPQWAFNASLLYDIGNVDFFWSSRYVGKMTIGAYNAQNSFDGRPPLNADLNAEVWYPETFYHNLRIGFDMRRDARFYLGVDNIFDTLPPFNSLGGASGDPYDVFGRRFYAGFSVKL